MRVRVRGDSLGVGLRGEGWVRVGLGFGIGIG